MFTVEKMVIFLKHFYLMQNMRKIIFIFSFVIFIATFSETFRTCGMKIKVVLNRTVYAKRPYTKVFVPYRISHLQNAGLHCKVKKYFFLDKFEEYYKKNMKKPFLNKIQ